MNFARKSFFELRIFLRKNAAKVSPVFLSLYLGGRFGYFLFFFCSGRGNGESEVPGGGGGVCFLIESPKGGVSRTGGADGPEGCLQPVGGFGRGLAKYFFSGPKCPPSYSVGQKNPPLNSRQISLRKK